MSLEAILCDMALEKEFLHNPERYFVAIFDTPSNSGKWGWRVEGHRLPLNFTLDDGKIVSSTPAFFGSNPAEVRQGPRQGLRTPGDLNDCAVRLFRHPFEKPKPGATTPDEATRFIAGTAKTVHLDRPLLCG